MMLKYLPYHLVCISSLVLLKSTNFFEAYKIENYLAQIKSWRKDAQPQIVDKLSTNENGIDDDHVIEIIDHLEKTPLDDRSYRGLVLDNGMNIVLVSDPKTNISNAHLVVASGGMNDPKEYLGLSHLLEHLLCLGSKKYPERDFFQNYISERDGIKTAYTSDEYSGYAFSISSDSFPKAFDTWANFFIEPLLDGTTVEKEINAVHSEYNRLINNDYFRTVAVYKTMCEDPSHGYCNFVVGSKESLLESARQRNASLSVEARKLFDQRYSANLMFLTVIGPQTLEQLASLVVPLFSQVADKRLKPKIWGNPYGKKNYYGKMLQIVPINMDNHELDVYFSLPDVTPFSEKHAISYLDEIISFDKSGSFSESLDKDNLTLFYYGQYINPIIIGVAFYRFNFELTETGLLKVDEILLRLFSFIQTIKDKFSNETWIYDELKQTFKNQYLTKTKDQNIDLGQIIGHRLRRGVKIREVLVKKFQIEEEFDHKFLQYVLSFFNVDNFHYAISSKSFKGKTSNIEHYFGTEYNLLDVPEIFLHKLRNVNTINVKIPQKSRFQYSSKVIDKNDRENSTADAKV